FSSVKPTLLVEASVLTTTPSAKWSLGLPPAFGFTDRSTIVPGDSAVSFEADPAARAGAGAGVVAAEVAAGSASAGPAAAPAAASNAIRRRLSATAACRGRR